MSTIGFVLLGCGSIAEKHVRIIQIVGQLVAVIDLNSERRKAFAQQYHVPDFETIADFHSANIKAAVLVICTPNGLHAQQTIEGLSMGLHVMVEKPVALTSIDINHIQAAEKKYNRNVFPVMQNRFNPALQVIHAHIKSGMLGDIYSFQVNCFWCRPHSYYQNSWHGSKALDGGVLHTQLSHFIDLLSWYFGPCIDAKGFTTKHSNKEMDIEDAGTFSLLYRNRIVGSIQYSVNTVPSNIEGSFSIHTSKGSIKIGGSYLNKVDYNTTNIELPAIDDNNYHYKVYENLVAYLNKNAAYYTSLEEARATISTIEKMYSISSHV